MNFEDFICFDFVRISETQRSSRLLTKPSKQSLTDFSEIEENH